MHFENAHKHFLMLTSQNPVYVVLRETWLALKGKKSQNRTKTFRRKKKLGYLQHPLYSVSTDGEHQTLA